MISSLTHRTCPRCATPVGWQRFLLKAGIWARWPCPSCGAMLKFSWKRRLLIGVAIVVMGTIAALISFLLAVGLDLPVQPVAIVVYLLLVSPVLLLDGVEVA